MFTYLEKRFREALHHVSEQLIKHTTNLMVSSAHNCNLLCALSLSLWLRHSVIHLEQEDHIFWISATMHVQTPTHTLSSVNSRVPSNKLYSLLWRGASTYIGTPVIVVTITSISDSYHTSSCVLCRLQHYVVLRVPELSASNLASQTPLHSILATAARLPRFRFARKSDPNFLNHAQSMPVCRAGLGKLDSLVMP